MLQLRSIVALALMGGAAAAVTTRAVPFTFSLMAGVQEPDVPEPTKHHKKLLASVGEWAGTLEMNMPGAGEVSFPATESVTAIGTNWTQAQFHCEIPGMPYHGTGVMGYEPDVEQFVGTWVDNMSQKLAVMRGTQDEDTGAIEMRWRAMTEGSEEPVPHRSVTIHEKNSYTSTFFVGEGDAEVQNMTISMTRKTR